MTESKRRPGAKSRVTAAERTQTLEDLVDASASCRHPLIAGATISLSRADRKRLYDLLVMQREVYLKLVRQGLMSDRQIEAALGASAAAAAGRMLAKQLEKSMGKELRGDA